MMDLSELTPSDLRRCIRALDRECAKLHTAARWLLGISCIEFVVIVWLLCR